MSKSKQNLKDETLNLSLQQSGIDIKDINSMSNGFNIYAPPKTNNLFQEKKMEKEEQSKMNTHKSAFDDYSIYSNISIISNYKDENDSFLNVPYNNMEEDSTPKKNYREIKTDNPALKILNFSKFSNLVREEIHCARTNPIKYSIKIEKLLKENFDSENRNILYINDYPVYAKEGKQAFLEAYKFLKNITPISSLKSANGLTKSAEDLVNVVTLYDGDFSNNNKLEEIHTRMNKYGAALGNIYEMIDYGSFDPEFVVINLLVCDGDKTRKNRSIIFNKSFRYIGVSSGLMPSDKVCTVVNYSEYYYQKGDIIPSHVIDKFKVNSKLMITEKAMAPFPVSRKVTPLHSPQRVNNNNNISGYIEEEQESNIRNTTTNEEVKMSNTFVPERTNNLSILVDAKTHQMEGEDTYIRTITDGRQTNTHKNNKVVNMQLDFNNQNNNKESKIYVNDNSNVNNSMNEYVKENDTTTNNNVKPKLFEPIMSIKGEESRNRVNTNIPFSKYNPSKRYNKNTQEVSKSPERPSYKFNAGSHTNPNSKTVIKNSIHYMNNLNTHTYKGRNHNNHDLYLNTQTYKNNTNNSRIIETHMDFQKSKTITSEYTNSNSNYNPITNTQANHTNGYALNDFNPVVSLDLNSSKKVNPYKRDVDGLMGSSSRNFNLSNTNFSTMTKSNKFKSIASQFSNYEIEVDIDNIAGLPEYVSSVQVVEKPYRAFSSKSKKINVKNEVADGGISNDNNLDNSLDSSIYKKKIVKKTIHFKDGTSEVIFYHK